MSIPTSWALAYPIVLVAMLFGANPADDYAGQLIFIAVDVGAVIIVSVAMYYFAWRWEQMDSAKSDETGKPNCHPHSPST